MDELLVEQVLRAVEQVPAARIVSYGDLAALVGTGPRQVGRIMSSFGSEVPWWRVTNASGELPEGIRARALDRWRDEGIPLKANGRGCQIRRCRADLIALADAWELACADLPSDDGKSLDPPPAGEKTMKP